MGGKRGEEGRESEGHDVLPGMARRGIAKVLVGWGLGGSSDLLLNSIRRKVT
jgi:hypothetical protein